MRGRLFLILAWAVGIGVAAGQLREKRITPVDPAQQKAPQGSRYVFAMDTAEGHSVQVW